MLEVELGACDSDAYCWLTARVIVSQATGDAELGYCQMVESRVLAEGYLDHRHPPCPPPPTPSRLLQGLPCAALQADH